MQDLHSEIKANIELVNQKNKNLTPGQKPAAETIQFIKVLGEDVRQFIQCMREEIEQVVGAISERDDKCKLDMERIDQKVGLVEGWREQVYGVKDPVKEEYQT